MAHVALDRLLGEVQTVADLAVDEAFGDELEDFDLARGREVLRLRAAGPGRELDQVYNRVPASCDRLEAARVLAVTGQDLLTLSCVHVGYIGRVRSAL